VSSSADLRQSGCLGPEGLRFLRSFDSLGWTKKHIEREDSRFKITRPKHYWRFSSLGEKVAWMSQDVQCTTGLVLLDGYHQSLTSRLGNIY